MRPGRESRGPVADAADIDGERRGTGNTVTILLLECLTQNCLHCRVEFLEGAWILASQIQVEPRVLRNRIETGAAPKPHHRVRRAWCVVPGNARNGLDAAAVIRDAVASRSQRAMHDPLDAGAVQGDKGGRSDGRTVGRA